MWRRFRWILKYFLSIEVFCFVGGLMLLLPIYRFGYSYYNQFKFVQSTLFETDVKKAMASGRGMYFILDFIENNVPLEDRILIFRKSEFAYYGKHKYGAYTDHLYTDLYKTTNKSEAWNFVRQNEIKYILTPPYYSPMIYNSAVSDLLGDPAMAELITSNDGYRLFKIVEKIERDKIIKESIMDIDIKKDNIMTNWEVFSPSFEKSIANSKFDRGKGVSVWNDKTIVTRHDNFIGLLSGKGIPSIPPQHSFTENSLISPGIYLFNMDFEGNGYMEVLLYKYANGELVSKDPIWSGILNEAGRRKIDSQFEVPSVGRDIEKLEFRIGIILRKEGNLTVSSVSVDRILATSSFRLDNLANKTKAKNLNWSVEIPSGISVNDVDWGINQNGVVSSRGFYFAPFDRRKFIITTEKVPLISRNFYDVTVVPDSVTNDRFYVIKDKDPWKLFVSFDIRGRGYFDCSTFSLCSESAQVIDERRLLLSKDYHRVDIPVDYNCDRGKIWLQFSMPVYDYLIENESPGISHFSIDNIAYSIAQGDSLVSIVYVQDFETVKYLYTSISQERLLLNN